MRHTQMGMIRKEVSSDIVKSLADIIPEIGQINPEMRLPLAELAVGTLKSLSKSRFGSFAVLLDQLVNADAKVDLFEYALQRMVLQRLVPVFNKARPLSLKYSSISQLIPSLVNMVSCLAYEGSSSDGDARRFFKEAVQNIDPSLDIISRSLCGINVVDAALKELTLAVPAVKRKIIEACVRCVAADSNVTIAEAELLRAISDALDCPIPPFMPGTIV